MKTIFHVPAKHIVDQATKRYSQVKKEKNTKSDRTTARCKFVADKTVNYLQDRSEAYLNTICRAVNPSETSLTEGRT